MRRDNSLAVLAMIIIILASLACSIGLPLAKASPTATPTRTPRPTFTPVSAGAPAASPTPEGLPSPVPPTEPPPPTRPPTPKPRPTATPIPPTPTPSYPCIIEHDKNKVFNPAITHIYGYVHKPDDTPVPYVIVRISQNGFKFPVDQCPKTTQETKIDSPDHQALVNWNYDAFAVDSFGWNRVPVAAKWVLWLENASGNRMSADVGPFDTNTTNQQSVYLSFVCNVP